MYFSCACLFCARCLCLFPLPLGVRDLLRVVTLALPGLSFLFFFLLSASNGYEYSEEVWMFMVLASKFICAVR